MGSSILQGRDRGYRSGATAGDVVPRKEEPEALDSGVGRESDRVWGIAGVLGADAAVRGHPTANCGRGSGGSHL